MIKVTIQQEKQYTSLGDWYRDDVAIEFDNLYKLQSLLDALGVGVKDIDANVIIALPKMPALVERKDDGEDDAKEAES